MGEMISLCFGGAAFDFASKDVQALRKGYVFSRKKDRALGLMSKNETVIVTLDHDDTVLAWRALRGSADHENLALSEVSRVAPDGERGVAILDRKGKKRVELVAPNGQDRDEWLNAVQAVLTDAESASPAKAADGRRDEPAPQDDEPVRSAEQDAYWDERKAGLDARQRQAAARRNKYAAGAGSMKHTKAAASKR